MQGLRYEDYVYECLQDFILSSSMFSEASDFG